MSTKTFELTAEAGQPQLVITHEVDAPRERVFEAFTDPAQIPEWWGPAKYATTVHELDARFGGVWRFSQRDDDGDEFAFRGVYHEVTAPERIVYTFEFERMPGHILMETIELEEADGRTRLTDTCVFQSVEDRDGMLSGGMEDGAAESMERLTALVTNG